MLMFRSNPTMEKMSFFLRLPGLTVEYCRALRASFFMPCQERQRIPQKLPPSPLPSELLRAAAYARHRRGQGGVILMELDAGENDPMKESTVTWMGPSAWSSDLGSSSDVIWAN